MLDVPRPLTREILYLIVLVTVMMSVSQTADRTPTAHTIGAVFDAPVYQNLSKVFHRAIGEAHSRIEVNGFSIQATGSLYGFLTELCAKFDSHNVEVIVAVANESTIHEINMVASNMGVPVVGYITDANYTQSFTKIHHPMYLRLEPNKQHMAKGLTMMLEANNWFKFSIIVDEVLKNDGFYQELKSLTMRRPWYIEDEIFMSSDTNLQRIDQYLSYLKDDTSRRIVLHAGQDLAGIIFRSPVVKVLEDLRHSWIITEDSVTRNRNELAFYPQECLALILKDAVHIKDILDNVVSIAISSMDSTLSNVVFQERRRCRGSVGHRRYQISNTLYRHMLSTTTPSEWGPLSFDNNGIIKISNIIIKYLGNSPDDKLRWHKIGDIRTDLVKLSALSWSGDDGRKSLHPFGVQRMTYRVVTNPVKPFVMEQMPYRGYNRCYDSHPCLKLPSKDNKLTLEWINDFLANPDTTNTSSRPYNVSCCRGLSIDLLKKLSEDLNFNFVLYIVADSTYGVPNNNGTWSGIVGDLIDGTAHIAVAAMSITRKRSRVIDFTYPYFFSRFSVLLSDRKREASWYAFLEPFSTAVWCGIFLSGIVTSIVIAIFEWNSPFGLNPWGRKRKTNYSLGSGVTMVLSILFGHTVKTKSPKAWPSKVMQNFWAPACIFILASYTANMASFIAGKNVGQKYSNIHDPKLRELKIGLLKGSAVESLLNRMQSKIYETAIRNVTSSDVGIGYVINGTLDGYLGDHPILDYARAKLDPRCELKLMKQTFGEDAYGIGVKKGSPLGPMLSDQIKEYSQTKNVLKNLESLHFADPQCYPERRTQKESQLAVTHHAGLFIMLIGGLVASIVVLTLEHCIFRWCVPRLRLTPCSSVWRSSHVMFFSQRLHRIITSAELVSPHDSAREILRIMRNREFSRLFQKSTIRKNRLADMAKTKRLNRNFFDVVEKAKWMQELREKNLIDDDSPESCPATPNIVEIQLKDLGRQVEEGDTSALHASSKRAQLNDNDTSPRHCVQYEWPEQKPSEWLMEDETVMDETNVNVDLEHRTSLTSSINDDLDRFAELRTNSRRCSRDLTDTGTPIVCPVELVSHSSCRLPPVRNADKIPNGHIATASHHMPLTRESIHTDAERAFVRRKHSWGNDKSDRPSVPQRQVSLPHRNTYVPPRGRRNNSHRPTTRDRDLATSSSSVQVDDLSKEDLLLMWKNSETNLNLLLDQALYDKERLERRLRDSHEHADTEV